MPKFLGACCVLLMMSCSLLAQGNSPQKEPNKPPRPPINLNRTPLDGPFDDLETKINGKLDNNTEAECVKAKNDPEDPSDPKPKHKKARDIVAKCKLPKHLKDLSDKSDITDFHGRKTGKKIKRVHTVFFNHPRDRYLDTPLPQNVKWDKITYTGRPNLDLAGAERRGSHSSPSSIHIRNASLPGSNAINDDFDCIDLATGQHLPGVVKDEQGNIIDHPCFADFDQKILRSTLTKSNDTYVHQNGRVYSQTEYDALPPITQNSDVHTTLQEVIDEDGSETPNIDDDGDGLVDEDPPVKDPSACQARGGQVDADAAPGAESCDFTHGVQKELQDKGKKHNNSEGKKFFKMNDDGTCSDNPDDPGLYPCGEEPREVEVEETLTLRCPPNSEYVEEIEPENPNNIQPGQCRLPNEAMYLAAAYAAENPFAQTTSTSKYAMMGFTFAPPVLEWGINESWRVCIFGICWEVFGIRFGYEFDIAAGLRLPVEVTADNIPAQAVAEDSAAIPVSIVAKDFRAPEFTQFCHEHNLDSHWYISDCDRFAFPEYFESMLPDSFFGSIGRQGSEFVAHSTIFAGLQVRVFSIPVVNYAIDSSVDVPAICTLKKMMENKSEWVPLLLNFAQDLDSSKTLIEKLEGSLANCSSFTTPYGRDDNGDLRQFPFMTSIDIPADCVTAKLEAMVVGGQEKPACTGLLVNIYGATLGVGLRLTPIAQSQLIGATAASSGDADMTGGTLDFEWGKPNPVMNVTFDNYSGTTTLGTIKLDDFTYYLNYFGLKVEGLIQLGGILSFIGNVGSIPLVDVGFGLGHAFPIGQHPGTGPITLSVPVTNYALSINSHPRDDAAGDTLGIEPGTAGAFGVDVHNLGTAHDTIDNFRYNLSNRPVSAGSLGKLFDRNNDFDCKDKATGTHFVGDPYDGVADDCYDEQGIVRTDRAEEIDEDGYGDVKTGDGSIADQDKDSDGIANEDPPGDDWLAAFSVTSVPGVAAETTVSNATILSVTPYQHPLTRPGIYPVRLMADSYEARTRKLHSPDQLGQARTNAEDTVYVRIESFFKPDVMVFPAESTVKPGGQVKYDVEAVNGGNQYDQIAMLATFADSDTLGCTLTTNGKLQGCPYRAQFTRIDPATWTNVSDLDALFPPSGKFAPLGNGRESLTIIAPADWAGMVDTVYDFTLTATSTADPAQKARKEFSAKFKVTATKQSMARYLNLEIADFMAEIDKAKAAGAHTRGIQPVMLHPVTMKTTNALDQILAGDLGSASKTLSSAIKVMEAVDRMVAGASLAEPMASDWKARSAAILSDMAAAQASRVQ